MKFVESGKQKLSTVKNWFVRTSLLVKIIIVVVIVGIGWLVIPRLFKTQAKPMYQTAKAEKGTLVVSISASGTVSSVNSASVTTTATGMVTKLFVQNGAIVQKGQTIAEIEPDQDSQQKRAAAYASYLNAVNTEKTAEQTKATLQSQLEQNRQAVLDAQNDVDFRDGNTTNPSTGKEYTRLEKDSLDSALTSARQTFSATEKKYLEADAAITAGKASINSLWLAYQQASPVVTAPIAGTLNGLSLREGSMIAPQASSTSTSTNSSGQKIATISTSVPPIITVSLTEIDVPKIHIGDKTTITVDAFPDKTYVGQVVSVDTAGSVSSGVTTYPTAIQLVTDAAEIYPNMSASASIITETKTDVLLVPVAAVQKANGTSTVRVLKNDQIQIVPVETGSASDTQIEILSGLSVGDTVVTSIIPQGGGGATLQQSGQSSPFSPLGGSRGGGGRGTTQMYVAPR